MACRCRRSVRHVGSHNRRSHDASNCRGEQYKHAFYLIASEGHRAITRVQETGLAGNSPGLPSKHVPKLVVSPISTSHPPAGMATR
jgi:hypothetical protein